jgi:hypothetical protein
MADGRTMAKQDDSHALESSAPLGLRPDQVQWLQEHANDPQVRSLVQEAVDRVIAQEMTRAVPAPQDDPEYQSALAAGFGMWADRKDLDGVFERLRKEATRIDPGSL